MSFSSETEPPVVFQKNITRTLRLQTAAAPTRTTPLISLMNVPSVSVPHPSASTLDPRSRFAVTSHFSFTPSSTQLQLKLRWTNSHKPQALVVFARMRARLYLYRGSRTVYL